MTGNTVLVTAADETFAAPAAVALLSAATRSRPGPPCLLLDCGLSAATAGVLQRRFDAHELRLHRHRIDDGLLSGLPVMAHLKPPTFARLAAPELAAAIAPRSLYIDADTLTVAPVDALLATDLGDRPAAAVQDPAVPFVSSPGGVVGWAERGLAPAIAGFNAGVLLIDNERWLARGLSEQALELLRDRPQEATFADQGALNAVLRGEWIPLAQRWNVPVPRSLGFRAANRVVSRHRISRTADLGILHFNGIVKPWEADYPPTPYRRMYARAWERLVPDMPALKHHSPLRWARSRR